MWRLEVWISQAEKRIDEISSLRSTSSTMSFAVGDLGHLEEAFQNVHELTLDLKSHEPLKASVESLASHLVAKGVPCYPNASSGSDALKAEEVKGKLAKLRTRWGKLEADTTDCLNDLGFALYEVRIKNLNLSSL
jgi:hypothetical protein